VDIIVLPDDPSYHVADLNKSEPTLSDQVQGN